MVICFIVDLSFTVISFNYISDSKYKVLIELKYFFCVIFFYFNIYVNFSFLIIALIINLVIFPDNYNLIATVGEFI